MENIFEKHEEIAISVQNKFKEIINQLKTTEVDSTIFSELEHYIKHIGDVIKNNNADAFTKLNWFEGVGSIIINITRSVKSNEIYTNHQEVKKITDSLSDDLKNSQKIKDKKYTHTKLSELYEDYKNIRSPKQQNPTPESKKNIEPIDQSLITDLKKNIDEQYKRINFLDASFESLRESSQEKINSIIEDLKEKSQSKSNELNDYIDKELPESKTRLQRLNMLHGFEGGQLLAQHYTNAATQEYRLSLIFRALTIIFLLISAYISYSFAETYQNRSQIPIANTPKESSANPKEKIDDSENLIIYVSTKISLIVILLGGASWIAKESSKHLRRANHLSNKGIALNTIDLYIAAFNDDEKNSLKTELANYFFSEDSSTNENEKDGIGIEPKDIIGKLIDKIPSRNK